jgi:hypothetical protein
MGGARARGTKPAATSTSSARWCQSMTRKNGNYICDNILLNILTWRVIFTAERFHLAGSHASGSSRPIVPIRHKIHPQ